MRKDRLLLVNEISGKRPCRVFVVWPLEGGIPRDKRRHLRWGVHVGDKRKTT